MSVIVKSDNVQIMVEVLETLIRMADPKTEHERTVLKLATRTLEQSVGKTITVKEMLNKLERLHKKENPNIDTKERIVEPKYLGDG